jgi:WD40 repeat protein
MTTRLRFAKLILGSWFMGLLLLHPSDSCTGSWQTQTPSASTLRLRAELAGPSVRLGYGWSAPMAFSPDGKTLALGSHGGSISIWDVSTGRLRTTLSGHKKWLSDLVYSRDGRVLASASGDQTAKLWSAETNEPLASFNVKRGLLSVSLQVSLSPNGRVLAVGTDDKESVRLWDIATGDLIATLPHKKECTYCDDGVNGITFSSDGQTLATIGSFSGYLWSTADWHMRTLLVDDRYSRASRVRVHGHWQDQVETFSHASTVYRLLISPSGRWVATASRDGTAKLWELATGKLRATLKHDAKVHTLAFSADSRTLATGSEDFTARLWNVETGDLLATLPQKGTVWSLAFSPDGRLVASGSDNEKAVNVWDTSGNLIQKLSDARYPVAFSPDGRTLATAKWGQPGTVLLWDVPVR